MEALQQLLMVLAVFGGFGAFLWFLKTKGLAQIQLPSRAGHAKRLELLERLPLSPQHSVCLIRVDGNVLTVGLSPAGCQILPSQEGKSSL